MTAARRRPRLLLDLQGAQDVRNGDRGIGRVAAELARALVAVPDAVAGLLLNPGLPFPGHLPDELLRSPLLRWNTAAEARRAAASGPVAFHMLSPFELSSPSPLAVPEHALRPEIPLVCHLHDLIPLGDPDRYLPGDRARRYRQRLELLRSADLVLAVSAHTRAEGIRLAGVDPERCVVVGNGASDRFHPTRPGEQPVWVLRAALPRLVRRAVLCVSGADERKNTERLINAYALLPPAVRAGHQLVVTCQVPEDMAREWEAAGRAAGLRDDELLVTRQVADGTLVALYQTASLLVMPSLQEGFGLPVVEAVASGCVAITSTATALPEVLDYGPSSFDPHDVRAMSDAIRRALVDEQHREELLAAGRRAAARHTWERVAERTLSALDLLTPRVHAIGAPSRRRRLALVGPLPPERTGIADYNLRLVMELRDLCDLDVLTPARAGGEPLSCRDIAGVRRFGAGALGRTLNPASYDLIVYTVGNSEHHFETYELALRWPGLLHLHDVRLGGLYREYGRARRAGHDEDLVRRRIERDYGLRVPYEIPDPHSREMQQRHGFGLTRELVRCARGVLVNSPLAERLLLWDQGPDAATPPVFVGFLPNWAEERLDSSERQQNPPLIGAFGVVDPVKAPERIIEALPRVRDTVGAELVFCGPVWERYRDLLLGRANHLGVRDQVSFAGDLDAAAYRAWLRRVSVSVQLRLITNGESSGAVNDCLSCGVPVVTNIIDSANQYPTEGVVALPFDVEDDELAAAIVGVIADESRRETASRAAHAYARERSSRALAERLMAICDELEPLPLAMGA